MSPPTGVVGHSDTRRHRTLGHSASSDTRRHRATTTPLADAMRVDDDDDDDDDGLDAHRRVLGVTREASIGDVRRAFLEVAKRAHPDVATMATMATTRGGGGGGGGGGCGGCGRGAEVSFRDAVEAREVLVRSMVYASRGGLGGASSSSSSSISMSFGAGAARTAGTPQTKAYAAALAAPAFVVAAVVMFAFPSTKTYGHDREFVMGRVHGVMNVPVNPWLKPEATRPAKTSNEDRMWRRVFGGGERGG